MSTNLVIYHGGCRDGFCAAWVTHHWLSAAEYLPGIYGQDPPDVVGRQVFIVDFSYPRPVLERMNQQAALLAVLDHHQTAEAALAGLPYAIFSKDRSGAGMAFDYWYPAAEEFQTPPWSWIVNYVEDRDLWRHALPMSREVNAYISTVPFEFEAWDDLAGQDLDDVARQGVGVLRKREAYIREVLAGNARQAMLVGQIVPVVNAAQVDISEVLDALATPETPFVVGWWQRSDGRFQYSLRTKREDVDVSALAKTYGGGGHRKAAGFQLNWLIF